MTAAVVVDVRYDVDSPEFQLHVKPGGGAYCALVGWCTVPPQVDGGPPEVLEEAFAAALACVGSIALLNVPSEPVSQPGWSAVGGEQWLRLSSPFLAGLFDRPRMWLMATRTVAGVRTLFTGVVSWTQQQQVAFVLRDGSLPRLTRRLVMDLLGAKRAPIEQFALPHEVVALVMPAVDGTSSRWLHESRPRGMRSVPRSPPSAGSVVWTTNQAPPPADCHRRSKRRCGDVAMRL